jgi:hypothetical protein
MYSVTLTGFSSQEPRKAIEAALCKTSELLEHGATLDVFPPHIDRTDDGLYRAEILAGVFLHGESNAGKARDTLRLKKIIDENEQIRLIEQSDTARSKAMREHLQTHLQDLGSAELSSVSWMALDMEQARNLQDHVQKEFFEAGNNYIIVPHVPYPHRVWPELSVE